jgi:hypothetical protein
LEVWVDSFESLSRAQLAALLPHIGDGQEEVSVTLFDINFILYSKHYLTSIQTRNRPIADRQFVKNVQFYLHKCGNVTLGQFSIQSSRKGPVFVNKAGQKLPLTEVPPMPSNIRSFKQITIKFVCFSKQKLAIHSFFSYYNRSVLVFLQEFGRSSLLTNVKLTLCSENRREFDAISQMMAQLLPSITSIESLTPYYCYDHNMALFQEKHSHMLASTRILLCWSVLIPILKLAKTSKIYVILSNYVNLPKKKELIWILDLTFKLSIIYSVILALAMMMGTVIGFTFQVLMGNHEFCWPLISKGLLMKIQFFLSSKTSRRFENNLE